MFGKRGRKGKAPRQRPSGSKRQPVKKEGGSSELSKRKNRRSKCSAARKRERAKRVCPETTCKGVKRGNRKLTKGPSSRSKLAKERKGASDLTQAGKRDNLGEKRNVWDLL